MRDICVESLQYGMLGIACDIVVHLQPIKNSFPKSLKCVNTTEGVVQWYRERQFYKLKYSGAQKGPTYLRLH